jgi:HEPN domain-containing protein
MTKDEIVKYWIDSSEVDFQAMESLYDKGHYVWALFVVDLSEDQKNYLLEVTTFNIKTRYPDYKFKFHKKATKDFTLQHITAVKELRQWLIKKIKS